MEGLRMARPRDRWSRHHGNLRGPGRGRNHQGEANIYPHPDRQRKRHLLHGEQQPLPRGYSERGRVPPGDAGIERGGSKMSELLPPSKGIGPGLVSAAARHPEMVVIAADNAPVFTGMNVYEAFPGRAFDVGIAEQNMVTTAAGMATCGKMPFVMAYGNFLALRCAEQIRTFVAHTRRNVKMIGGLSGLSGGKEGPTHEASEDLAHVRAVPELVVLAPTDVVSAENAVIAAADWEGP